MPRLSQHDDRDRTRSETARSTGSRVAAAEPYRFSSSYQLKILAICLRDRTVLPQYSQVIKPEFFTGPLLADTSRLILEFYTAYKSVPSAETLEHLIGEHTRRERSRYPSDVIEAWHRLVEQMLNIDIQDSPGILASVVLWARRQSFKAAVLACSDLWESAERSGEDVDFESGLSLMSRAAATGVEEDWRQIDYFADSHRRLNALAFDEGQGQKIPLLLAAIDDLLGGGMDRGEMIVWAAPPSRGKSASLIWAIKVALYMRYNVVLFSCEMSGQKLAKRLDRSITGMTQAEQLTNMERATRLIDRLGQYRGRLFIVDLYGKEATVESIRGYLERFRSKQGFTPDVIAVDYPGEMRGSRKYEQRRFELAEVYRDLRAMAKEYDCVMHVPMQMNRQSLAKRVVSIADLAECFEVAGIADVIIGICQTDSEKEKDELRLFMAKHRDGQASYSARYKFTPALSQFVQMEEAKFTHVMRPDPQESTSQPVGGLNTGQRVPGRPAVQQPTARRSPVARA